MILWIWDELVVWMVCFGNDFDCLNGWLEIGNPKYEMEIEWFMIGQQEVVPNEKMRNWKRCDRSSYLSFNLSFR